ncbi:MAG: flagellar biosynthesis protein FlhA [Desulfomonilia bacterium]|jgi:flagellar biosynthesis protein FlhA|uniref:Putative flagellar export pore protein n=1 Tax=anaerobic digester metagenome TaxID=1263854 RepID=A0A485LYB8_9ZZZZ|nr:flagellar biosynthesis protein FlhA [Pseudomonadota bacterium]HPD21241.1 flagellar biosynthesis protein FlhA [Deltaproteobacteria bacterium]HPX18248.1 flagellar biosynthesis protein FlhA [Deltaproteobacteria bacterium]HRS55765.1 flagellar biosynthesis protein FlhA [Desulfomonilia bacterium]HRV34471.1 flagellar biosynthesis protein FlhA [Desulfomonilia bacterium]
MAQGRELPLTLDRKMASDLVMAIGVLVVMVIVLVPLPTFLLDILLTFSITIGVITLMVSMYTTNPLNFSVFPSLLLVVTLYRLALNIASTRLILLHGSEGELAAGRVINTFGQFVVGGSYVVGFVVFGIFVIINFVVITKGATRIGEVTARFTLDAMPGKQMAIDADLNAGIITEQEARERRDLIRREAEFYGAMDGATKFVRGDAIAGIIITFINIIGGIIIGVLQHKMPFGEALTTYTTLTIGDGLVSQIPALIISSAAGILVTQSAADKSIGRQLSEQLSFQPLALFSAAAIIFCFGLVPGMPHIAFLAIALLMGAVGWLSLRYKKEEEVQEEAPRGEEVSPESLLPMDILEFEIGYGLIPLVDSAQGGSLLTRIKGMRRTIAGDLGVIVPPIHVRDNLDLKPNEYKLMLKGSEIACSEAMADRLMLLNPENVQIDIPGIPVKEPAFGLPALWIKKSDSERAQLAGLTVVDASTVIATHLTEAIKNNAHELLGRQELQSILDTVSRSHPKVVEDLIPSTLPAGVVLRVFKNLLKEKVPVKNVLTILETLADYGAMTKDPDILTEYVRQALMRVISKPYIQDSTIRVLALDPAIDGVISHSVQHTEHGSYLALEPEKSQKILMTLNREVQNVGKQGLVPILLTSPVSRPYLKRLTERYLPDLVVLSHNEIPPDITIKNLGMVRVDAN